MPEPAVDAHRRDARSAVSRMVIGTPRPYLTALLRKIGDDALEPEPVPKTRNWRQIHLHWAAGCIDLRCYPLDNFVSQNRKIKILELELVTKILSFHGFKESFD